MAGLAFDDLIPTTTKAPPAGGLSFDDLIAPKAAVKARAPAPRPRVSMLDRATDVLATVNSHIPLGDEIAAAGNTAVNLMTGRAPSQIKAGSLFVSPADVGAEFDRNMGSQRGHEERLQVDHPHIAAAARGTGDALTAAVPAGKFAMTGPRALNMVRGATTAGIAAATTAAADRGTPAERLKAASDAAMNPVVLGLGAAGGALAPSMTRAATPAKAVRRDDAAILREVGITTSVPQRMGGMAKQTEDLAMRAPILGPAISGARGREVEQLNRAVGLKALEPVGGTIPKEIKPGFDMVEHVDDTLGAVYDQAAKMVPKVGLDDQLVSDFARIGERRVDLAESEARHFDSIVGDRLKRLQSGEASGETVKTIHSELGALQAEAARKGEATLSGMLADTRRALMGVIERANPEAATLIRKADEGWRIYSMMNDAAAAASNRGGIFLPGQLNTQVRRAAKASGSNMAGKGKGPLQELATAATRMIPDQFGNPGTANAVGLGGMGVGLMTAPVKTAAVAAGLTGAATPYWMMGRKILEELPSTASQAEIRTAAAQLAELARQDPRVSDLARQVAARLAVGGGAAGGQMTSQGASTR